MTHTKARVSEMKQRFKKLKEREGGEGGRKEMCVLGEGKGIKL